MECPNRIIQKTEVVLRTLALPRLPARRLLRTTRSCGLIARVGGCTGATLISGGMRHSVARSNIGSVRPCDTEISPTRSNSRGHRKNEIRHQHCHLERNELIEPQSEWLERPAAIPGPRLCADQSRSGNNILIGRPILPECRSPSAISAPAFAMRESGLLPA